MFTAYPKNSAMMAALPRSVITFACACAIKRAGSAPVQVPTGRKA